MRYFATFVVPVEADSPQDAQDLGFEKLLDADGPPEGLVEHVSEQAPNLGANLIAE